MGQKCQKLEKESVLYLCVTRDIRWLHGLWRSFGIF